MDEYIVVTVYRHREKSKGIVHTYGPYTRMAALAERRDILKRYAGMVKDGYEFNVHATKLIDPKGIESW